MWVFVCNGIRCAVEGYYYNFHIGKRLVAFGCFLPDAQYRSKDMSHECHILADIIEFVSKQDNELELLAAASFLFSKDT